MQIEPSRNCKLALCPPSLSHSAPPRTIPPPCSLARALSRSPFLSPAFVASVCVRYLTFVENTWCLLLGFVFIPALWLPYLGTDTPASTWPHFIAGAKCTFTGVSDLDPSAKCADLWWICCVWIACNVLVNVIGLAVCRKGDAVLFNLVNSVQLPLTNLLYASPFVMTAALATSFDNDMIIGLIVACVVSHTQQQQQQNKSVRDHKTNSPCRAHSIASLSPSLSPSLSLLDALLCLGCVCVSMYATRGCWPLVRRSDEGDCPRVTGGSTCAHQ